MHRDQTSEAEVARRSEAATREIRVVGDPVLRDQARLVEAFNDALRKVACRMIAVMEDAPGIGLAAPQIGVQKRLVVYKLDEGDPRILVNPALTWRSAEVEELEEGCLSVPGVLVPVVRAAEVRVRTQDLKGESSDFDADGLAARVIQHEVDHLDGVLMIDRAGRRERAAAMRELRDRTLLM